MQGMRTVVPINDKWKYVPDFSEGFTARGFDDSAWDDITLPHSNIELPYNGFDEADYQFVSCYRRILQVPPEAAGKRIALHFEGVMLSCTLWVNGREAGSHYGGYTPFTIDISALVNPGEDAALCLMVDSREQADIPPFGKVVDFLTYGGVYREVQMIISGEKYIESARLAEFMRSAEGSYRGRYRVELGGTTGEDCLVRFRLSREGRELLSVNAPASEGRAEVSADLYGIELWDIDAPTLYDASFELLVNGELNDCLEMRTGFRFAEFRDDGFYLNNRKLSLVGLNRHQSYPYAGYAMPERNQKDDADILKFRLGVNMVRTSHYPQSRHFLDRCDEIGLVVMEEIPGWQHIGEGVWLDRSVDETRDMVIRDAHHPSIVLWGVRINESPDHRELFSRTNAAARRLDPLRQTGGVRNFAGSEVLEDVYTFNDFTHDGSAGPVRSRKQVAGRSMPYLITEHNGHMYPTKRFDQEQRLTEHALRHGRVIAAARRAGDVAGAIGWCAFDYNTHREFGSGDRICYHGVMDMFRIPKYAAALYASQIDPARRIVMKPASVFAMGERNEAKNLPVYVFTNCDYIKVFRNGEELGTYRRNSAELKGLAYPPIVIDQMVGSRLERHGFSKKEMDSLKSILSLIYRSGTSALSPLRWLRLGLIFLRHGISFTEGERILQNASTGWGDGEQRYKIEGWFDGQCRSVREYGSSVAARLSARADHSSLVSCVGGRAWDATRVEFRLEDQFGNLMPFVNEYLELELQGPGRIIGPEKTALTGGVMAAWVRAGSLPGTLVLRARCGRFAAEPVRITVE